MAQQTVIGLFDNTSEAQEAIRALINHGFDRNRIDISKTGGSTDATTSNTSTGNYNSSGNSGDSVSNFFGSLFGSDTDDYNNHSEAARRGGSIVTVHAQSSEEANQAAVLLDQYNAIDVDARATQFRGGQNNTETNTAATNTIAGAEGATSIPVIEENLQVGKQTVETGGARLRSRIIERPVEENIRLREEHVHVERTPVNRPATEADINNFREGDIEMTERAEVPVVAKQAQIVEEVSLGKETTERQETVRDTVRGTEVDVKRIDGDTGNQTTRTARP